MIEDWIFGGGLTVYWIGSPVFSWSRSGGGGGSLFFGEKILGFFRYSSRSGQLKGYGFVQFDSEDAAQEAIEKLNGMLLNDKRVHMAISFASKRYRPHDKVK
ncbi:hypothetical protein KIW84_024282 [Lathyrus oleraceus]|uniref:RRM domain-containing protein n=1 Tax=Pisum sativum TaxID=3888 RepID=A0A9D4YF73_PEA|nr:hypothetical protein KIW84_024282 [Pisum sativum]